MSKTIATVMVGAYAATVVATLWYVGFYKPYNEAILENLACANAHGGSDAAWAACAAR